MMKVFDVSLERDPLNNKFGFTIVGDVGVAEFCDSQELRVGALDVGNLPKHNIKMRMSRTPWLQVLPGDRIESVNSKVAVADMVAELAVAPRVHIVFSAIWDIL